MNTLDAINRLRAALPVDPIDADVVTVKAKDLECVLAEFPCTTCVMVDTIRTLNRKLNDAYTVANALIEKSVVARG